VTTAEVEAAALRAAFYNATNTYPQDLVKFLSPDAEKAFRKWWGKLYESVTAAQAGTELLAELARLRSRVAELEAELRRLSAQKGDVP
jgi:hypothetical protein